MLEGEVAVDTLTAEPKVVSITLEKINQTLGTSLETNGVTAIFDSLQFTTQVEGDTFTITVPTRRNDIVIEADLIEEVARLFGYDNLPKTLPIGAATPGALTAYQKKRRMARRYLESAGLYQAITYSLTNEAKVHSFALEKRNPIKLAMPMSEERALLRQSIVPQLLEVLKYNAARQNENIAVYETGVVFLANGEQELPEEREHLAGAVTGIWSTHQWQGEKKTVDFFVVKGVLEGLFQKLGILEQITFTRAELEGMHPGRTAEIVLNGEAIGFVGQVHPQMQKDLDLKETYCFELDLIKLFAVEVEALHYTSIPRFPYVTRDIALVVDKQILAGNLQDIIIEAGGKLLKDVQVFDLYEGEKMEEGKKSIAFSLTYFDPEQTLTDEMISKAHEKVLEAVKEKAGASLRG